MANLTIARPSAIDVRSYRMTPILRASSVCFATSEPATSSYGAALPRWTGLALCRPLRLFSFLLLFLLPSPVGHLLIRGMHVSTHSGSVAPTPDHFLSSSAVSCSLLDTYPLLMRSFSFPPFALFMRDDSPSTMVDPAADAVLVLANCRGTLNADWLDLTAPFPARSWPLSRRGLGRLSDSGAHPSGHRHCFS